jgi:Amino acid synthesis
MVETRKIFTLRETIFSELGVEAARPITRAVGMAVIRNPFAGKFVEDLRRLFEAGAMLGERLMPELVKLLDGPQSHTARARSSVSLGKWSTAVPASIQCLANRCGPQSAAARR